jgi:predicted ribosome quality control (RQC) complex YloA/Tae2 family protein
MQTALHILNLVGQIQREAVGGTIVGTEFYKKERAAYLLIKNEERKLALGIEYHPTGHGCYLIPASKMAIDTTEKPWPVFDLIGSKVAEVTQYGLDRIFALTLETASGRQFLLFECLGPNGNLWLLNAHRRRIGTLRRRQFDSDKPYEAVAMPDRIDPRECSVATLTALAASHPGATVDHLLEKQLLGFNRNLAREAAERAGVAGLLLPELETEQKESLGKVVGSLAESFAQSGVGYLYQLPEGPEAFPFQLRVANELQEKHKTLSLAIHQLCRLRRSGSQEVDESKRATEAVLRAIKRLEKRRANTESDLLEAGQYEQHRRVAELLQIQYDRLRKGLASVTVDDIYRDPPQPLTIKLDSALSPQQNIEAYARKYRKGRDGHELLTRRLEITDQEIGHLREVLEALEKDFESAGQQFASELQSLLPKEARRGEVQPRLPYRTYLLSTGLTIFVGRDGADNDRTTFEFAKPYELWFHSQQCPGSHVIIKYPNKSFVPTRREIEETAAIAAFHSKARNDSLVPVIYAERRYVRKPRKAKPGLVTVEREKSIMVAPRPPKD